MIQNKIYLDFFYHDYLIFCKYPSSESRHSVIYLRQISKNEWIYLKNNSVDKIRIIFYNKENEKYRDKSSSWCVDSMEWLNYFNFCHVSNGIVDYLRCFQGTCLSM